MGGEDDVSEDDEAHRRREEGCRREEAIRGLLRRHDDKRLTIGAVEEIAQELGVSRSTMYRLITAYRPKARCRRLSHDRRGGAKPRVYLRRLSGPREASPCARSASHMARCIGLGSASAFSVGTQRGRREGEEEARSTTGLEHAPARIDRSRRYDRAAYSPRRPPLAPRHLYPRVAALPRWIYARRYRRAYPFATPC